MGSWFSSCGDEALRRELKDLKLKVSELEDENKRLTRLLTVHNTEFSTSENSLKISSVSQEIIESLVDAEMADPDHNIAWMPDGIERRLKVEIMMLVANMIDHMLETTRVQFMGHEMRFDLVQPKKYHD